MDTELLRLLSREFRSIFYIASNMLMQVYLINVMLKRRHSFWGIGILSVTKVIIQVIIIDADILKVAVISGIAEIPISFVGGVCLVCINLLEGREDIWTLSGEFQLPDFLFPVMESLIVILLCRILKPYLKRFGEHKIVHRKIWWFVFITYIIGASMTQYLSWKSIEELLNYIVTLQGQEDLQIVVMLSAGTLS